MTFDLTYEGENAGSALRNQAANLLSMIYEQGKIEQIIDGKKVDAVFLDHELGSRKNVFVECKDYAKPLERGQIENIAAAYSDIISKNSPALLLVVTRNGIAPGAASLVANSAWIRHLSIWELEDQVIGLTPYIRQLRQSFDEDGLSSFYIPTRAREMVYDDLTNEIHSAAAAEEMLPVVDRWLASETSTPIAILGGYGAGKTSFAKKLAFEQADRALNDPTARRPILIRLGVISRYNSLDGLLGAMFTNHHIVRNYSYHRFIEFNRRGRFLIMLDGFDEMKHAMSASDFKHQIQELNQLIVPSSKVILLGRPSAFTSDAEHVLVLRGRVKSLDTWRRLRGWPEFKEYRLEEFSPDERRTFITLFLAHEIGSPSIDQGWLKERAEQANRIADNNPELFSKPVHSKILAELACDDAVELERLSSGVSRWTLYDEFFRSLAAREMEKEARRPIGEEARLRFLREIAFWLWTRKGEATNFAADDLPPAILDDLPDGDSTDDEEKRREYLAGAFLERKMGSVYFFPHRSFAEFLVAQRMQLAPPTASNHSIYSDAVKEGVREFLLESPHRAEIANWAKTLAAGRGALSTSYLTFLAEVTGGFEPLAATLGSGSPWKMSVRLLDPALVESDRLVVPQILGLLVAETESLGLALGLTLLQPNGYVGSATPLSQTDIEMRLAAALLEKLLRMVREEPGGNKMSVQGRDADGVRSIVAAAVPEVTERKGDRYVVFDWPEAIHRCGRILADAEISLNWDSALIPKPLEVREDPLEAVLGGMSKDFEARARQYVRRLRSTGSIFVVRNESDRPQRR